MASALCSCARWELVKSDYENHGIGLMASRGGFCEVSVL